MKITIGYFIGSLVCLFFHELFFDTRTECKLIDSEYMCRTVHYGHWKGGEK